MGKEWTHNPPHLNSENTGDQEETNLRVRVERKEESKIYLQQIICEVLTWDELLPSVS